jgi:hypothetical protein
MLALSGGAIGNSRWLAIKESHHQSACLFIGTVGQPGTGKSIPLAFLGRPFEKMERQFYREFEIALALWEEDDPKTRGPKPKPRRCIVDDLNIESLVRLLSENPRGVIRLMDELSGFITAMDQYKDAGKGNERQKYLEIFNQKTVTVDRIKLEGIPLRAYRPFCPIAGGIQPDVVQMMRNQAQQGKKVLQDGLTDRFLFAFPEMIPAQGERWREISLAALESWDAVVNELFRLEMARKDGDEFPQLVYLTNDGKVAWEQETTRHAAEINAPDFLEWLRGPWQKFVGYSARLALIVQMLRYVTGEASGENVDGESVRKAWQLIDYFKAHTLKLLTMMGGDPRVADARKVLAWIASHPEQKNFSRSDVYVDLRRSFASPEALEAPLKLLAEHRYIQRIPDAQPSGAGRRPTPKYQVNPLGA